MNFPSDLPWILEYRVGTVILTTLPRRHVQSVGTSGNSDAAVVRPRIPLGCDGWRRRGETQWHALDQLPKDWLPFLNRERGTEMDFRPS